MSKLITKLNEYFYAWGDENPNKEIWWYGKKTTLGRALGYDDATYFKPRRDTAGVFILVGGVAGLALTGYGLYKGGSFLKAQYDKRKKEKENL